MKYECVLYEVKDKIARITFNRPEKMNALSAELRRDIVAALKEAEADDNVSVIVMKGAGRCWSSGYDMTPRPRGEEYGRIRNIVDDYMGLEATVKDWYTIWDLRKPVIAQVHGYCLAGGNDVAGMCDVVIAAENTQFGHPEVRATGMNMVHMEPFLMGPQKAKLIFLTGSSVSGKEAERMGWITKAVPEDELEDEVMRIAHTMAKLPPELLAINKRAVNIAFEIMGSRVSSQTAIYMDCIAHFTEAIKEFRKVTQEKGAKAYFDMRDSQFADYRTAKEKK